MSAKSLSFSNRAAIEEFVGRFRALSLPRVEWTHQAHLTLGLWHVLTYPIKDAAEHFRKGIQAYNGKAGFPQDDPRGYHETLTIFYLQAIAVFADLNRPNLDRLTLFNDLLHSRLRDRMLPLAFYSRFKLTSAPARREWCEPDLCPLSGLRELLATPKVAEPFYLRQAGPQDTRSLYRLVSEVAQENSFPKEEPSFGRFLEGAFSLPPRFDLWVAVADVNAALVGCVIFRETCSRFLDIHDMTISASFCPSKVLAAFRHKAIELAQRRRLGCRELHPGKKSVYKRLSSIRPVAQ